MFTVMIYSAFLNSQDRLQDHRCQLQFSAATPHMVLPHHGVRKPPKKVDRLKVDRLKEGGE